MLIVLYLFILGTMFGSLINVLIYRIPRMMPLVFSRSQCQKCHQRIFWYDNIPLISYIVLRGRCRQCDNKITFRYFVIELFVGIGTVLLFPNSLSAMALLTFLFHLLVFYIFITIFFIDLDFQIIPDGLNIYLGVILFLFSFLHHHFYHMALGFLLGGGFPLAITWIFYLWKGQIGLGGGDIKLFAVLGIYLGPLEIVRTLFLSCLLGSIAFLILMILKKANRKTKIPFGPFIVLVSSLQILLPDKYHGLVRLFSGNFFL